MGVKRVRRTPVLEKSGEKSGEKEAVTELVKNEHDTSKKQRTSYNEQYLKEQTLKGAIGALFTDFRKNHTQNFYSALVAFLSKYGPRVWE